MSCSVVLKLNIEHSSFERTIHRAAVPVVGCSTLVLPRLFVCACSLICGLWLSRCAAAVVAASVSVCCTHGFASAVVCRMYDVEYDVRRWPPLPFHPFWGLQLPRLLDSGAGEKSRADQKLQHHINAEFGSVPYSRRICIFKIGK